MTRSPAEPGKWNANLDERALADLCEATGVRDTFACRLALSLRPEGAAAAGRQVPAHAAATADRMRGCEFRMLRWGGQHATLNWLRSPRDRAAVFTSGDELAGVGVATL